MGKMDDFEFLARHREIWEKKPVLRRIYHEQFYKPLLENLAPGRHILEIGSGPGFIQHLAPHVWRTDILPSKWVHGAVDAHALPFASQSLDNVIGLDVLHHFAKPLTVLREVARVLRPGGRLVLVEPWITPVAWLIYNYLHQETCDMKVRPWLDELFSETLPHKTPLDGNPALPYRLVKHGADTVPELRLTKAQAFSFITYLLSGGFKPYCLISESTYAFFYSMENLTRPLWVRLAALRALIIWEKCRYGIATAAESHAVN